MPKRSDAAVAGPALTDGERAIMDRLTTAVGSRVLPVEWFEDWAEDGTFSVPLVFKPRPPAHMEPIGFVKRVKRTLWIAYESAAADDPVAEADTLAELAEALSAKWGGPGRWALAAAPKRISPGGP